MEYKIRKAKSEDLEIVQELIRKLCVNENRNFDSTVNPGFYATEEGKNSLQGCISGDSSIVLVAEDGGKIIAYVAGGVGRAESYRNIKYICELGSIWVEDEYRSKGVGKRLVEEFEKWCREKKVFRLRVNASASNERAIEFYRKAGFENHELILEKALD